MRVLVIGGGIGGLTTAIALKRVGLDVDLVEQSDVLAPVGGGIGVQANAMAILDTLGIELPAEDIGPIGRFEMLSRSGRRLVSDDPADIESKYHSVNIHRADLQQALLRTLEALGGSIELGRKVRTLSELTEEPGVEVVFEDDSRGRWDLVIGADGLFSTVRRALMGEEAAQLRYAGQTCWRFAMEAPSLVPSITIERWSPGRRIGVVPLSRGRIYVYMVESAPEGTPGPGSSSIQALYSRFSTMDERIDPILERIAYLEDLSDKSVPVHHGDLYEQPQISFGQGRVLLVGDAAHAMTPNLGQGAGMAIEDAAALALLLPGLLDNLSELPGELDRMRRARVSDVQRDSWRIGSMAHWKSGLACGLRDLVLPLLPKWVSRRQVLRMWQPGLDLARQLNVVLDQKFIRIEGLGKQFRKGDAVLDVLQDLDLELNFGEQVVVVGQSGSGKSTFLHTLGTLDRPTAGRVWFEERDVFNRSASDLDRLRNNEIGFVFQFHHLLPDHSALRNVTLPMLISGTPMAQAEKRATELLARVGLADRMDHRPGELSGGEQQRVAIARALVRKPRLILADEPTGNLDPNMASEVFELLVELATEWKSTLVVVTHSREIASRFSRRLVLQEGRFLEDGSQ